MAFPEAGAVGPGEAAPEAQLPTHHVGQVQVDLVVTHRPPGAVVEHLHPSLVGAAPVHAGQPHELGGRRWGVEERQEEERVQEGKAQHPGK